MAGNYLLSCTSTNCGNAPEARDGYFTTYFSFNKIVLDVITEKFNIQVDENTQTQAIFMDNDLTHITDDHFEINLIARLLNQIYVVQPPMLPMRYDDAPPGEYEYSQLSTSIIGTRPSAPRFPEVTFASYPSIGTRYGYTVRIYYQDVL